MIAGCSFDWTGLLSSEDPDERFARSMILNEGVVRDSDPGASYEFFALSDIHAEESSAPGLEQFYAWLPESGFSPALILNCGDTADTGQRDSFACVKNMIAAGGASTHMTLGNHDLQFDGYAAFSDLFGSSTYAFFCGPDLFICLDSANGTLGADQMAWFEGILKAERAEARYCFVFTHQNLFRYASLDFSYNQPIEEIYMLMGLYESYGVDYVFMGNDHRYDYRSIQGVRYITLESLSETDSDVIHMSVDSDGVSFSRLGL